MHTLDWRNCLLRAGGGSFIAAGGCVIWSMFTHQATRPLLVLDLWPCQVVPLSLSLSLSLTLLVHPYITTSLHHYIAVNRHCLLSPTEGCSRHAAQHQASMWSIENEEWEMRNQEPGTRNRESEMRHETSIVSFYIWPRVFFPSQQSNSLRGE